VSSETFIGYSCFYLVVQILPIYLNHVLALDDLPVHHRDPFDRILIAQASVEKQVIVTKDQIFKEYPVELFW